MSNLVPFGKYRGQPVEIMQADRKYCEWLSAQPWFKDKFQNLSLTIVNAPQEPQETPEHNLMQAELTNFDKVRSLIELSGHPLPGSEYFFDRNLSCSFEDKGWDCAARMNMSVWSRRAPTQIELCKYCNKVSEHWRCSKSETFTGHCELEKLSPLGPDVHSKRSWSSFHYLIECKPSIADDYPSVIRQIRKQFLQYAGEKATAGLGESPVSWPGHAHFIILWTYEYIGSVSLGSVQSMFPDIKIVCGKL